MHRRPASLQVNCFPSSQRRPPGQRQVANELRRAPAEGITVSLIAERTGLAKENVYEKLNKLAFVGWAEEAFDTSPRRWRLTSAARQQPTTLR